MASYARHKFTSPTPWVSRGKADSFGVPEAYLNSWNERDDEEVKMIEVDLVGSSANAGRRVDVQFCRWFSADIS